MNILRPSFNAANRGYVHDAPRAALHHAARGLLSTEKIGLQISGMNRVPIRFGDFEWIDSRKSRCVVHQSIERSGSRKQCFNLSDPRKIR
jgi:hypothetical protein